MKKYFILLPVMVLLFTGCGEKKEAVDGNNKDTNTNSTNEPANSKGTITCTLNTSVANYQLDAEYIIHYTDDFAESVETVETITSDSKNILDEFETTFNNTYNTMNDSYGGYTISITNENGKVVSNVKIDYSKMNIEKLVQDQPTMKLYVKDNKMLKDGLQTTYKSMGATCK